jgi:uncharacterized protein (TIGR03085 family)
VSLASRERAELCHLFADVGPDAPTLCAGWTTRDLAAHLLVRERRPWAALGVIAAPMARLTESAMRDYARRPWPELVALVRHGPPIWSLYALPKMDDLLNGLEYFVHHEDVRRAAAGWTARALPDWAEAKLWRGLSVTAKFTMRRSPVGVTLVDPATGDRLVPVAGTPSVTLRGAPSELLLYAYGRDSVAVVEIEGDDAAVRAFTSQTFTV